MEEFNRERDSKWLKWKSLFFSYRVYFAPKRFEDVKQFLLFIGYPRSGHTLIGAVLDAHPEVLLSHELDAFGFLENGVSMPRVWQMIQDNSIRFNRTGRKWMGYNYLIPGQWQGKYRKISIVGDKSGGITNRRLLNEGIDVLVPKKGESAKCTPIFLHVIRNPYDIISTMTNRTTTRRNEVVSKAFLARKVKHFFQHAEGVAKLKANGSFEVIDLYHEDFVADPKSQLSDLCDKLQLSTSENYLSACAGIVWKKASRSRDAFPLWNETTIADVAEKMKPFPWFDRYQFQEPTSDEQVT